MIDFLRDIYHKLAEVPVIGETVVYLRNNLLLAGIIFALGVFLLVILCVMLGLRRKAKKAAKAALKEAQSLNAEVKELAPEAQAEEKEETPAEVEVPAEVAPPAEPEKSEPKAWIEKEEEAEIPPAEKPAYTLAEEPVVEPAAEVEEVVEEAPAEVEEVVEETPAEVEEVVEEAPAEVEEVVEETPAEVEEVVEEAPAEVEEVVEETPAEVEEVVEETPAEVEEVVEEAPAEVEEVVEEAPAEVEEVVEEAPAEVEEVVEETPAEVEEVVEEAPAEVEEVVEEAPAEVEEVVEETPAEVEEVVEEAPAEVEEVVEEAPAEVEEVVEEAPAEVEEVVEEAPAEVEEVVEEAPAEVEEVASDVPTQAQDASETIALLENMENHDEFMRDHYDENETDKLAKSKGKWAMFRAITDSHEHEEMYFFELHGPKEETLLSSEEYTTYQGALRGIQTYKTNILKGNLKLTETKNSEYTYKLLSGKNMLLCVGDSYPTKAHCQSAMDTIVRYTETAIEDENLHDIVIKVPQEDSSSEPIEYTGEGKWIISTSLNENGVTVYSFNLFDAEDECLLSSEEYTTYVGAVNGIQTYKRNLAQNNFKIMLTRRGDYTYKLLNANGQLLCLGDRFKTKQLCVNAVEEIKYFSANSPTLTKTADN